MRYLKTLPKTPTEGKQTTQNSNVIAETSELDLISNMKSSTEKEQEMKENNLRRSKRLTKTNPIGKLKTSVPSAYLITGNTVKRLDALENILVLEDSRKTNLVV